MDGQDQIDGLRRDFIDRMGIVVQGEGMPRSAGQIFALLVFDGGAIAFGDLATTLELSRATVSTSIRILEDRGVIRRVNKRGERQDYFQLADDAYLTKMTYVMAGVRRAKSEIDDTLAKLPPDADDVRRRLSDYAGFYEVIGDAVAEAMTRLPLTKP